MQLSLVNETDMSPGLDAKIREGLCLCFPADAPVFQQTRAWHGSKPSYSIVLEEDNQVLAHVGVVDRMITVSDIGLHVAGVQNVFVRPEHRGKGLFGQVMRAAMSGAVRRDFDCGLLFCVPELEKVYAPWGWRGLGVREVIRIEDGREIPIPGKNIALFYPIRITHFPGGLVHLQGNDW